MKVNAEKSTGLWMGLFIVVLSIIYLFVSLGKTTWVEWIALVFGIFLSVMLFIESGIITYFNRSDYRKITIGDFVVWITVAVAVLIFLNSILLIGIVKENAPLWLINFSSTIGVISAVIGAVLGLVHLVMPRFK